MKLHIKSKSDLKQLMDGILADINSCVGFGSNMGIYESGYAKALNDILDAYEDIYQAARMEHAVIDARNHLRDYFEDDDQYEKVLQSGIPEEVAERFIDTHDCNVAENDQYESIIENVLKQEGWL